MENDIESDKTSKDDVDIEDDEQLKALLSVYRILLIIPTSNELPNPEEQP